LGGEIAAQGVNARVTDDTIGNVPGGGWSSFSTCAIWEGTPPYALQYGNTFAGVDEEISG
jgi:hypothetical protein